MVFNVKPNYRQNLNFIYGIKIMTNVKTLSKVIAIALLATAATQVTAAETRTYKASVTVKNAFEVAETTALSFGTVRAQAAAAAAATTVDSAWVILATDGSFTSGVTGTATPVTSKLQNLQDGSAAEFAISDVSNFTAMTITMPASIILTAASSNPTAPKFTVDTFTFKPTVGTSTDTDFSTGNAATITSDGAGQANFLVGATLTTGETTAADMSYSEELYEGSYDITVSY